MKHKFKLQVSATKQVARFRTEFINETLPKLQYAKERLAQACQLAWQDFLRSNLDNFRVIVIGIRYMYYEKMSLHPTVN